MVLMCQKDSYLKEYETRVTSCMPLEGTVQDYGHSSPFRGFGVECEDTILFPTGGGQPHDCGSVAGVSVVQVERQGERVIHYVTRPLPVGQTVRQELDWGRRFTHMQQHTGQHLLSAVLDSRGVATCSWWLGRATSYVAVAADCDLQSILPAVEERCNELIRSALPVTVSITGADTADEQGRRGLPDNAGPELRVVSIEGVDTNPCCGTHVRNLSELQCIKILSCENGKKGETLVHFAVGGRVLATMQSLLTREAALTAVLNNEPAKHVELVGKLQLTVRSTHRCWLSTQRELARLQVETYERTTDKPRYMVEVRSDVGVEWARALSRGLEGTPLTLVAGWRERWPTEEGGGVLLQGPHTAALADRVKSELQVKGAMSCGRLQGRAADLSPAAITRVAALLADHFGGAGGAAE